MAAPVVYTPRPFAGERYRPDNGRLIDIALARSAAIADSARQSGNISALMYGRAGEFAAKTLGEIAQMGPAERARQVEAARYRDTLDRQQRAEQMQRDEMAQRQQERQADQEWRQRQSRNTDAGAAADDMRPGETLSPDAFASEQAGTASARRFSHDPATDGYGVLAPEASPDAMPEHYTRTPNFAEEQAVKALQSQIEARKEAQRNTVLDNTRADEAAKALAIYRDKQLALSGRRTAATEAGLTQPAVESSPLDPGSQDLMSQAGLSYNAFLALSGKMAQLPRDRATRTQASNEVAAWARKRGVDVSTFTSQYKAYNDTLEKNIERQNNIITVQDELVGDVASLRAAAAAAGFNKLRAANAVNLWMRGELNSPEAADYAFALQALTNDIARYNAASTGRAPLESDMADAKGVIRRGMSSGGLDGLHTSLTRSVANMNTVMDNAVDRSRANVWKLFGVGDKYKPKAKSNGNPDR